MAGDGEGWAKLAKNLKAEENYWLSAIAMRDEVVRLTIQLLKSAAFSPPT